MVPLIIHVHQDIVPAVGTNDFISRIAGDSFRPLVPVDNFPVPVDEIDTVMQVVEKTLV
jgi:hypothetical protein